MTSHIPYLANQSLFAGVRNTSRSLYYNKQIQTMDGADLNSLTRPPYIYQRSQLRHRFSVAPPLGLTYTNPCIYTKDRPIIRGVRPSISNELVEGAKRTLWDSCGSLLTSLPYLARRDSENRSQLMANLEDIVKAFDTLDASDSIPDMFCEASALYLLPTLSLDPVGKQVQANTHVLQSLESAMRGIEQKIASLVSLSSSVSVNTASNGVSGGTGNPTQQSVPSYASTSLP